MEKEEKSREKGILSNGLLIIKIIAFYLMIKNDSMSVQGTSVAQPNNVRCLGVKVPLKCLLALTLIVL